MQVLNMPPDHHESQGSGCGQNAWINHNHNPMVGLYSPPGPSATTMSPMQDYSQFDFQTTLPTPGSMQPAYRMARPPPYAIGQMPPPIITSQNVLWPSMIASGVHPGYQQPVLAAAPVTTPLSAGTSSDLTPTSAKTNNSRRKLTDEERRQMCLEAEQNPNMKQTQIGAKFNVERSTVSKILRQKDKYMNLPALEDVVSPGKKSKTKLPDFEKTLLNWVRNQQKKGLPIDDDDLRKQARVLSFTRSDQALVLSSSWLEKFKQKNQLGQYAEHGTDSTTTTRTKTSPYGSPASSEDNKPAFGMDSTASDFQNEKDRYFDFDNKDDAFDCQDLGSPPEDNDLDDDDVIIELPPTHTFKVPTNNHNRQRSQTLSNLEDYIESQSRPGVTRLDAKPPLGRALTSSLVLQSHVDPVMTVKRHKSVPDIHDELGEEDSIHFTALQPPPLPPQSESESPVSHPTSPAEDENMKALENIKKLLENNPNVAEADDYVAVGKLMGKMKLLRSPTSGHAHLHGIDGKGRKRQYLGIS